MNTERDNEEKEKDIQNNPFQDLIIFGGLYLMKAVWGKMFLIKHMHLLKELKSLLTLCMGKTGIHNGFVSACSHIFGVQKPCYFSRHRETANY